MKIGKSMVNTLAVLTACLALAGVSLTEAQQGYAAQGYEEYPSQYQSPAGVQTFVPPPGEQLPGFANAFSSLPGSHPLPATPNLASDAVGRAA